MPRRTRAAAGGERGDYSPLADEELISLMGAGDAGAFAALYDRHSRAVYSLSYRMAGEKQAAEDLAQDAFLKVWRSAGTYRAQRGSVKTWILTVVHNRGIDLLRSSASRRRTREEAEAEAPRSQPSEAFSEAWGNHRRDRLREALRDIPHEQREAVTLVHFSGLTQTEVSERLGLPLGTVKGRVRLGLRKLRDHPCAPGDGGRVAVP
jgi:RNA polymerase sigma-70 factor (ECF subfamily)